MSNLTELAAATKCDFTLEFNPHKSSYQSAKEYITNLQELNNDPLYDEVGTIDYTKDIWTIQVYPSTPVGFIAGVSNNLDELLDWAIEGAKDY